MKGAAPRPPVVDVGEPVSIGAVLREALTPSPGRLRSSLLVVTAQLLVLAIWEGFRLPQPAIATFLLLMIARGNAASTIGSAVSVGLAVPLGGLIAVAAVSMSLSQPALRLALMALMVFATMLLVRGTILGPAAFITGFFAVFGTSQADNLLGLAMSTGDVTNSEGFGRPQIDYVPPEEALLHALLWLGVAAALPALLLALLERLAGTDPRRLLLDGLRARCRAAAAFCQGEPGAADRLRALGREGIAPLLELMAAAERAHRAADRHDAQLRLLRGLDRLVPLLAAWDLSRPHPSGAEDPFLRPAGALLAALGDRLRPRDRALATLPPLPPDDAADALDGALPSLAAEIGAVLAELRAAADRPPGPLPAAPFATTPFATGRLATDPAAAGTATTTATTTVAATPPRWPVWRPDALGAANIRFALKVTLAVMLSYVIESGLAWQGLGSLVTCFFVALGTIGETVNKMTLRIVGCLVGAGLGIGSILLLMPLMTGFGQLALLFGAVALPSAWIGFGSPRISYAGWQILLAFGLTTLQGYGPTLDMQTARDRVVGILLGNLVTGLVFLFVWPVSVGDAVRRDMAAALDTLGGLMALDGEPDQPTSRRAREHALRESFVASVTRAGGVIPNDRFEPHGDAATGAGRLGRDTLARLARLIAPISAIATDGLEPWRRDAIPARLREEVRAYHRAMQDWFAQAAAWTRTGRDAERLRAGLPQPPSIAALADRPAPDLATDLAPDLTSDLASDLAPDLARRLRGRIALYALATREIDDFLDHALPTDAAGATVRLAGSPSLAAG